jgi:hypothetical protein
MIIADRFPQPCPAARSAGCCKPARTAHDRDGPRRIAPARPGEIVGEGMLVRRGRSIAFMEGRLTDPQGNLLTTASATGQIRLRAPAKT